MIIFPSQIVYCEDDFHSPTASTSPPASPTFHLRPRRRRKTSSGTRHKDEEGEITIECQRLNREHQLEKVGCTSFKHLIQTLISSPVYPTICELLFPGCSLCIWVGVSRSCRQKSWTAAKPASKDAESTGDYWNDPCSCCLLFFWSTTLHFCQKPQGIFPACHFHLHLQNDLFCFLAKKKVESLFPNQPEKSLSLEKSVREARSALRSILRYSFCCIYPIATFTLGICVFSFWMSYLISLNPLLFKNIAHFGSFKAMYLCNCVFVSWKGQWIAFRNLWFSWS